jgi:MFS family permease
MVSTALGLASWCCLALVRHPPAGDPAIRFRLTRAFDRRVALISPFMVLLCVGWGALSAFVPLFTKQVGLSSPALFFSAYAAGALVARFFSGAWYDRHGPVAPTSVGLLLLGGGWLALAYFHQHAVVLVAACALGLGFGVAVPAFTAMAMDLVTKGRRGAANATVFTGYDLGTIVGAVGAGPIAVRYGLVPIFLLAAALVAAAGGLFFGLALPTYLRHRLRIVGAPRGAEHG